MARVIDDQQNVWGKRGGVEPQRSDLWKVDFTQALSGLSRVINGSHVVTGTIPFIPPKLATYFINAVTLPDLKIRADMVRRDSRPYQMPSWDEPCDAVRMAFILDCFRPGRVINPYLSDIYQMLDTWRAVVRSGRGGLSSEFSIDLDTTYSIDYAFNVGLDLLRGDVADFETGATNDLQYSMRYTLVNCWLSAFRMQELNYESTRVMQLEAMFYTEDIRQSPLGNPSA